MSSNKVVPMKGTIPRPPQPKLNPKSSKDPQPPAKDAASKTNLKSVIPDNEDLIEVGESKCSRIFGYTLAFPFVLMALWYGYMMFTFREVITHPNYNTAAAVENVLNVTLQANLPLAKEFAPYYRYFLSVYLSNDFYTFLGASIAHVLALLLLGLFVFNLSFSQVNQQSFTSLAFGNMTLRRFFKTILGYSKSKGLIALYLALTFSSLYALPFVMVPVPSKATFEPVLTGNVSSPFNYLHYVYYSASLGAASVILVIWYTLLAGCFKLFGPYYPDFKYMSENRKKQKKMKPKSVVMGVAPIG